MRKLNENEIKHGIYSTYSHFGCRCVECTAAAAAHQRATVARRKVSEKPAHVHGTVNGYGNYGCRCDPCKAAWSATVKQSRARRSLAIPDHVHGTDNGYTNYRCRCTECRSARRKFERTRYQARYQARK